MRLLLKITILLVIPFSFCSAQPATDSMSIEGSPVFKMNGMRYFWLGRNYRKEWRTPVKVPILNMATYMGGLTPQKRGGGKQTRSLTLLDPKGRAYSMRSVRKYVTDAALPPDLRGTFAKDLVSDGVSASYPYAALSVPEFSRAIGIPYGSPKLVYVPDDPLLGEFRPEFANTLVFLEVKYPDSVNKSYDTEEVVAKLQEDNDNDVDQAALLRARLLDNYYMDLDRHEGQWNWAAYDYGKGKIFYPMPKDRDQALFISQGFIASFARKSYIAPGVQGFRAKAKNINGFNFAARNLDRFFLNEMNEQDWQAAKDKFLTQVTDDVIEKAIMEQPKEIVGFSADKIIKKLKDRRNYFGDEMMKYYRFISKAVSVTGSDKTELFDITRNGDGSVLVQVNKISKEGEQTRKMYERTFDPAVTKEIRLYGLGGDDKFNLHGEGSKIRVRMIGGSGDDLFESTASSSKGKNIIYDLKSENNKVTGNDFRVRISNDTDVNNYDRLGFKYDQVIPFLNVGFNPDDGLFLGYTLKLIEQGFRKKPYKCVHQLLVNHSLSTKAWNFRYYSEFIGLIAKKWDLIFDADIKAPNNTINFFGYGNSTFFDKSGSNPESKKHKFYRARFQLGDISLLVRRRFTDWFSMTLGPTFEFYKLDPDQNKGAGGSDRFILMTGSNGLDPATLFEKQSYIGGKLMMNVDNRNSMVLPSKGVNWVTTLRMLSGMNDFSNDITQLNSDISAYFKLGNSLTFAARLGGGTNFGDDPFEFYHAQFLGGTDNLRGYRKFRFAGKSCLYNNLELRLKLADFRSFLFPGSLGLLAFHDIGRVWYPPVVESDKWHSGYGVGFWFAPLKRIVLALTYAASKEEKKGLPLVSVGFQF